MSTGKTKLKKSMIVLAIKFADRPCTYEDIMNEVIGYPNEEVDQFQLLLDLAEMVARKRLVSYVDDEGQVVYENSEVA